MKTLVWMLSSVALATPLIGCGSAEGDFSNANGGAGAGGNAGGSGNVRARPNQGVGGANARPQFAQFTVSIENVSAGSPLETPISPGVWLTHTGDDPLFEEGQPDYGEGLEAIAEDGNPDKLAISLRGDKKAKSSGKFETAVGAVDPGPALPKSSFEFLVTAKVGTKLSFATMLAQSNDVFLAPAGDGIPLFDARGAPLGERDVTSMVLIWNAGTEHDQAPGMGPDQAPRQTMPNTGSAEGAVSRFSQPTRAIPSPRAIVDISVSASGGTYTIVVENISVLAHLIETPLAPIFWATHDATWSLFQPGTHASAGLERLAEDASPDRLVADNTGAPGVGRAQGVNVPDGASGPGPAMPGQSYTLIVAPDAAHPRITLAAMVGESNDAFIGTPPEGVALLDATGAPREAADVELDLKRMLATWDAGTEANEPSGVGVNQAPRQTAPNTGPADPNDTVRLYADATNDLAGGSLGGFANVGVVGNPNGQFTVTITNTSQNTVYPGTLSPVTFVVHDGGARIFENTEPASQGLERLAEDGTTSDLANQLAAVAAVKQVGVADTPLGAVIPGPLMGGESYRFTVTPDAGHRYLDIASMVVPSNDTFMAFDPGGIALLDANGSPRSDSDIAADIAAHLFAWDAGTELNEAGAAGPDQAPRQVAKNSGPIDGDGLVRSAMVSPWPFPEPSQLVRVTIRPFTTTK